MLDSNSGSRKKRDVGLQDELIRHLFAKKVENIKSALASSRVKRNTIEEFSHSGMPDFETLMDMPGIHVFDAR